MSEKNKEHKNAIAVAMAQSTPRGRQIGQRPRGDKTGLEREMITGLTSFEPATISAAVGSVSILVCAARAITDWISIS